MFINTLVFTYYSPVAKHFYFWMFLTSHMNKWRVVAQPDPTQTLE